MTGPLAYAFSLLNELNIHIIHIFNNYTEYLPVHLFWVFVFDFPRNNARRLLEEESTVFPMPWFDSLIACNISFLKVDTDGQEIIKCLASSSSKRSQHSHVLVVQSSFLSCCLSLFNSTY